MIMIAGKIITVGVFILLIVACVKEEGFYLATSLTVI